MTISSITIRIVKLKLIFFSTNDHFVLEKESNGLFGMLKYNAREVFSHGKS